MGDNRQRESEKSWFTQHALKTADSEDRTVSSWWWAAGVPEQEA